MNSFGHDKEREALMAGEVKRIGVFDGGELERCYGTNKDENEG